MAGSLEQLAYEAAGMVDQRHDLVVRHPRGAQYADDARQGAHAIRSGDEREGREPGILVLAADRDREAVTQLFGERLTQQIAPLRDREQPLQPLLGGELRLAGEQLRAASTTPAAAAPVAGTSNNSSAS